VKSASQYSISVQSWVPFILTYCGATVPSCSPSVIDTVIVYSVSAATRSGSVDEWPF
jgi:hypothetical protein